MTPGFNNSRALFVLGAGCGWASVSTMLAQRVGKRTGCGGSLFTIAGTKAGLASDDGAEAFTASRKQARQPNSCCGLRP